MHAIRNEALALAATVVLVLTACDAGSPGPVDAPAADPPPRTAAGDGGARAPGPAAPAADAIDATRVVERGAIAGADGAFDVKAFAGTYATDGATLALAADGSYAWSVRAESADAWLESTGTWTVEDGGTRLRLDPDSKSDADRVFAIRPDGTLGAEAGDQVLRRDDA